MQELATFGAGCFWGIEAAFRRVPGVIDAASGYSGGRTEQPTYKDVCSNSTGHAEVVQVTFDPEKVSYPQLLDVFWTIHDPTQVNRQGPDLPPPGPGDPPGRNLLGRRGISPTLPGEAGRPKLPHLMPRSSLRMRD